MNDKDKKNKDKIKFSDKIDGKKIVYEVEKIKEKKSYTADDRETRKAFKNVSGNNWFFAITEWKSASDKEWRKTYQPKPGFWILLGAAIVLIGGIIAFVLNRKKKKSLDEEKFL